MLQGSLDDFALDEILGLLAETSKSGQLDIKGDRGTGALTVTDGKLGDATASNCGSAASTEDVMFELLRYREGSFVFSNKEGELTGEEKNVAGVLSVAESRLADWEAIAEMVPTLQHIAIPSQRLPEEEITIDRSEWDVLRIIASECEVAVVCDELELGEVEGSRIVKHLIERGLISLRQPTGASSTIAKRIPKRTPAAAEPNPEPAEAEPEDESLVASLRSGTPDTEAGPAVSVPPLPGAQHGTTTAVAEPELDERPTDGGGLLMRYLKGEEG